MQSLSLFNVNILLYLLWLPYSLMFTSTIILIKLWLCSVWLMPLFSYCSSITLCPEWLLDLKTDVVSFYSSFLPREKVMKQCSVFLVVWLSSYMWKIEDNSVILCTTDVSMKMQLGGIDFKQYCGTWNEKQEDKSINIRRNSTSTKFIAKYMKWAVY